MLAFAFEFPVTASVTSSFEHPAVHNTGNLQEVKDLFQFL